MGKRGPKRRQGVMVERQHATLWQGDSRHGALVTGLPFYARFGRALHQFVICRCKCGKTFVVNSQKLKKGDTKSCGCIRTPYGSPVSKRRCQIWETWKNMKARCADKRRRNYGAKGIVVCDEWRQSFPAFRSWAKRSGYRPGLCIDRIDPDGPYSPANCQWITKAENTRKVLRDRLEQIERLSRECARLAARVAELERRLHEANLPIH